MVGLVVVVLMLMLSVWVPYALSALFVRGLYGNIFLMSLGIVPFAITWLLLVLLFKWLILGHTRVGLYEASAWNMARLWFLDTLLQSFAMTLSIAILLDPAVGVPAYLKLLGAEIGCALIGMLAVQPEWHLCTGRVCACSSPSSGWGLSL